jgi:signal transduction histidine kinase
VGDSLEDRTQALAALSNHLQALSEREKSELARKLHDELGGLLTAAKMDLSWLQSRLEGPVIQERLAQLGSVLDEAMDLKRRVVEELRPSLLDHFGLPTTLRAYVESTCGKAGLRAEIHMEHACESMPKETAIALFRVVQEGLSNIIRHAHATTVRLEMNGDKQHCWIALADDGNGFDGASPQLRWSHGLMGMRQRAESLSGRLTIESKVGGGTKLRLEVPLSRQ